MSRKTAGGRIPGPHAWRTLIARYYGGKPRTPGIQRFLRMDIGQVLPTIREKLAVIRCGWRATPKVLQQRLSALEKASRAPSES